MVNYMGGGFNVFNWDQQVNQSFQEIKALIVKANETPLRYYDRTLPVTVQADTSLRGLGACLIQQYKAKDQLIAFASKSLMDTESWIEGLTTSHS